MPVEFHIIAWSMLPVTELRVTIPWFLFARPDLGAWYIYLLAVIGNILPNFLILWLLPVVTGFVHRHFPNHNKIKRIIEWVYRKSHARHSEKFYRYGSLALVAIVAIPFPGTGSYTGSLLAFLFNVPYWKAISLISLGVAIAGIIVLFISLGGIDLLKAVM